MKKFITITTEEYEDFVSKNTISFIRALSLQAIQRMKSKYSIHTKMLSFPKEYQKHYLDKNKDKIALLAKQRIWCNEEAFRISEKYNQDFSIYLSIIVKNILCLDKKLKRAKIQSFNAELKKCTLKIKNYCLSNKIVINDLLSSLDECIFIFNNGLVFGYANKKFSFSL